MTCNTCGCLKWLLRGLNSCQNPNCKAHKQRMARKNTELAGVRPG